MSPYPFSTLDALNKRLLAVWQESRVQPEVLELQRKARGLARKEAHAEIDKGRANERFTQRQAEMMSQLRSRNAASELEDRRARAEADITEPFPRPCSCSHKGPREWAA